MLTAAASWPTSSASLVLFVLRGVLISLGLFGLLRLDWVATHIVMPVTFAEGALAVRLFGISVLPVDVTLACSGTDAVSLCLGAILAYPATWRHRVTGAFGAIGMILALNVLRIGTIGRVSASRFWFDALHLYIWPAAITLLVGAYVLVWMRISHPATPVVSTFTKTSDTREAPLRLSRRFIAIAGLFLLAFIAAAPLYLNSAVVIGVASFIAKSAAAILGVAGVHAFATANTLWMPHGGFVVTEECISTPLIPIYLAAIAAYAPNWRQRSLGIIATGPIFVALGIARLLVVALPSSAATQTFFIHAFYQLLGGAVFVFAAAFWRHRNKTAFGWGLSGVGAGALFLAIAGPVYLRLIAAVVPFPAIDPQGAVTFLPAFQTALYLALAIAAFTGAGWKRIGAGLAVLIGTQVVGLIALNAVMNHTAMTMAVRDVRGWALAAPVLIFATVVSLGRPRR